MRRKHQKKTVFVIENNVSDLEDIYAGISDNFPECICYPSKAAEDFTVMQTLINKTVAWNEESTATKKQVLGEELANFIRLVILEGNEPDFAVIDICLKEGPEEKDHAGCDLRKDILQAIFPKLQVLYSSNYPETAKLDLPANIYNYNNLDKVLSKTELGEKTKFRQILIDAFEKYSGILRVSPGKVIIRNRYHQPVEVDEDPSIRSRNSSDNFILKVLDICAIIKTGSIALSFAVYIIGLLFLSIKFLGILLLFENPLVVSEILQVVEKLFIIPLPMIIVTGISIFFDQVIVPRFSPKYKFQGIEPNSKYYINLSKSLFISTLISVLAIMLIEMSISISKAGLSEWKQFAVLGFCAIVLFVFYFAIARSLHQLLAHKTSANTSNH